MTDLLLKTTSGRWLLTVTGCYVWYYCTVAGIFDGATNGGLMVLVIKEYFDRQDREVTPSSK